MVKLFTAWPFGIGSGPLNHSGRSPLLNWMITAALVLAWGWHGLTPTILLNQLELPELTELQDD